MNSIAVIMPFKNSAPYIGEVVKSIYNQTGLRGHRIWLVAVDDGSTDDSRKIVGDLIREYDSPATLGFIMDSNGVGPAGARNLGLEWVIAQGDITHIAFCDSDDVWYPWHLSASIEAMISESAELVYSDVDVVNERDEPLVVYGIPYYKDFDREKLKEGNFIFISTVVMSADCLYWDESRFFSSSSVPMEDWEYWLRMSYYTSVYHLPRVTSKYMWKSTGSYYTAEESAAVKQRIITRMKVDPMTIEGWLSLQEGDFLAKHALGKSCIEIGSYKGRSTRFIASAAERIVCIDTFRADFGGQEQMDNLTTFVDFTRNTMDLKNITPLVGKSQDVHGVLRDNEYDFIFIDGMHDFESVLEDVRNYYPKLKTGAEILFHDYNEKDWPGVVLVVKLLFGGPDEVCDTIARVTLTEERRMSLATIFMSYSVASKVMNPPDLVPIKEEFEIKHNEFPALDKKIIVIAPFAQKLPGGKTNPKDYPYWEEVVSTLRRSGAYVIQVGVAGEPMVGADETRINPTVESLKELVDQCDTFISVDTFFQHFATYYGKRGVVIFSQSDPKIFGHITNINLLKSETYLRGNQFEFWHNAPYVKEAFVLGNQVVEAVLEILNSPEYINGVSEK